MLISRARSVVSPQTGNITIRGSAGNSAQIHYVSPRPSPAAQSNPRPFPSLPNPHAGRVTADQAGTEMEGEVREGPEWSGLGGEMMETTTSRHGTGRGARDENEVKLGFIQDNKNYRKHDRRLCFWLKNRQMQGKKYST